MGPVTGAGAGRGSRPSRRPAPDPAAQARQWAEQTASSQGLPARVTDPSVLRDVAVLLAAGREPDIRGERHGARSELARREDEEGPESSLSAWWKTVEVWERVGPVELFRSDDGQGPLYAARCDECGGAAGAGWERDGGAVVVAAVRHGEQAHGEGSRISSLRPPEDADALGVEGVASLDCRADGQVVDQSGHDRSLTGRSEARPLTPEGLTVADESF